MDRLTMPSEIIHIKEIIEKIAISCSPEQVAEFVIAYKNFGFLVRDNYPISETAHYIMLEKFISSETLSHSKSV